MELISFILCAVVGLPVVVIEIANLLDGGK